VLQHLQRLRQVEPDGAAALVHVGREPAVYRAQAEPETRVVTAEELFQYPDSEYYELVRGVPSVSEPPGGVHGSVASRIVARLADHVERLGLGSVLVEAGYVLKRSPDTVRGPDVSFMSLTRLPPDRIPEQFIPGAPDLAVEILSPSSRWSDVEEKIADYFAAGARLVWMVDLVERRAIVRYPDRPPRIVAAGESLDGEDVVPGFALALAELFTPLPSAGTPPAGGGRG
jgi:Uma2 family endonuclease